LKNKCERERFESGDSAYIISKEWLKKYKQYILYKEVKRNNKPAMPEINLHPGMIDNDNQLCEVDEEGKFLKGTGKIEQFPVEIVDKYIREDLRERYQYKVINQELW
jgi:hypothetical protein